MSTLGSLIKLNSNSNNNNNNNNNKALGQHWAKQVWPQRWAA